MSNWTWAQNQALGTHVRRAAWPAEQYVVQQPAGVWTSNAGTPYRAPKADRDATDWELSALLMPEGDEPEAAAPPAEPPTEEAAPPAAEPPTA